MTSECALISRHTNHLTCFSATNSVIGLLLIAIFGGFLLYRGLCTAHLTHHRIPGAPSGNSPIPNFWTTLWALRSLTIRLSLFMSHLYYFPFPIVFLSPCLMHKPHYGSPRTTAFLTKANATPFLYPSCASIPLSLSQFLFSSRGRPVSPCLHL